MDWAGCPERIRSAAGEEFSAASGWRKSTIFWFMTASIYWTPVWSIGGHGGWPLRAGRGHPARMGIRGSVAGERGRRLEADLDATLEGLVVGCGFTAREAFAHALDDQPLLRHAGLRQLERHHFGPFLREALIERVVATRIREPRDAHADVLELGHQRAQLLQPRAIAVAHRGLPRTELHRRAHAARLGLNIGQRKIQRLDVRSQPGRLGLARRERLALLVAAFPHDGADGRTDESADGATGRGPDNGAGHEA